MNINIKHNYYILLFLVMLLWHVFFALQMTQPIIFNDEQGYIGFARYIISGELFHIQSYYPLYAIAISPIFMFVDNLQLQYHLVLFFNAILISCSVFLVYGTLQNMLKNSEFVIDERYLFIATLMSLTFPFSNCITNLVANENLYIFLSLLYFWILSKTKGDSLVVNIFLLIMAFLLYMTHPIGLSFVAASFFCFCYKSLMQKNILHIILFVFCFIVLFILCQEFYSFIYEVSGSQKSTSLYYYLSNPHVILTKFLSVSVLYASIGQLSYLMYATSFFLVSFLFSVKNIGKKDKSIYLIVMILLLNFMISVYFMGQSERGGDHFIYGRYNERILPLIIGLGTYFFLYYRQTKVFLSSALLFCLIVFIYIWITPKDLIYNGFNVSNVLSYLYFIRNSGDDFFKCLLMVSGFFALLPLFLRFRWGHLIIVFFLFVMNIYLSVYALENYFIKDSGKRQQESQIPLVIKKLFQDQNELAYKRGIHWNSWSFANYKYNLPNMHVYKYDYCASNELPNLIVSGCHDDELASDYYLFAYENHKDNCLFVRKETVDLSSVNPDSLIDYKQNNCSALDYTFRSQVMWDSQELVVTVTNLSDQVFLNKNSIKTTKGSIRLIVLEYNSDGSLLPDDHNHRRDFSFSVYPGQASEIRHSLDSLTAFVRLKLVKEGYCEMYDSKLIDLHLKNAKLEVD